MQQKPPLAPGGTAQIDAISYAAADYKAVSLKVKAADALPVGHALGSCRGVQAEILSIDLLPAVQVTRSPPSARLAEEGTARNGGRGV